MLAVRIIIELNGLSYNNSVDSLDSSREYMCNYFNLQRILNIYLSKFEILNPKRDETGIFFCNSSYNLSNHNPGHSFDSKKMRHCVRFLFFFLVFSKPPVAGDHHVRCQWRGNLYRRFIHRRQPVCTDALFQISISIWKAGRDTWQTLWCIKIEHRADSILNYHIPKLAGI